MNSYKAIVLWPYSCHSQFICVYIKPVGDEASEWISSHLNAGAPSEAKIMKLEWQTIQIICRLIKILQQAEREEVHHNTCTYIA